MTTGELPRTENNALCLRIVLEEGLLVKKLLFHQKHFPESTANLALIMAPFLAFIAYSMPVFLDKALGVEIDESPVVIDDIRHRMKSLDLGHMSFEEYSHNVHVVLANACRRFCTHHGLMGILLNSFVPDVGITYYDGIPIESTFATAYNLYGGTPIPREPEPSTYIGYSLGNTLAFAAALADSHVPSERAIVPEFVTASNDFRFASLVSRFYDYGQDGVTVFFLLSERMTTLSSVKALRKGGFLDVYVWIKLETVALYHVYKSISNLIGYIHRQETKLGLPDELIREIQGFVTHEEKRSLKKMRKLRNAFAHYDFGPNIVPVSKDSMSPWEILQEAIQNSVGMSCGEYMRFLLLTHDELVAKLQRILRLPRYTVWRDPDGR